MKAQYDGAEIITTHTIALSDAQLKNLYDLYVNTYSYLGHDNLWWKTLDLFIKGIKKYACTVYVSEINDMILSYVFYQEKKYVNKISLVCHNGTIENKNIMVKLLRSKLIAPGWVIEASDALGWVLRREKIPIIRDLVIIKKVLEVNGIDNEIILNDNFDEENKNSYQYEHIFRRDGHVLFTNKEILFGTLRE